MVSLKRIDLEKERNGVWIENPAGFSIKVRAFDSPRIQELVAKGLTEAAGKDGAGKISDEAFAAMLTRIYADEVLIDWKDIDQAPTFSKEKALEFMSDPELREFQRFVTRSARDTDRFQREGVEAIKGN